MIRMIDTHAVQALIESGPSTKDIGLQSNSVAEQAQQHHGGNCPDRYNSSAISAITHRSSSSRQIM
jgi:hypothetical protein